MGKRVEDCGNENNIVNCLFVNGRKARIFHCNTEDSLLFDAYSAFHIGEKKRTLYSHLSELHCSTHKYRLILFEQIMDVY